MLALAWAFESFEMPIEPQLAYQAFTDPYFDADAEMRKYIEEQVALTGEPPNFAANGGLPALIFRRYEEIEPSTQQMFWWQPGLADFRASPHRNRLIRELGIDVFWRSQGFPPQCRPVGEEDFECD